MALALKPQGVCGLWADQLMEPLMCYVSGAPDEEPQRTHYWNNDKIKSCAFSIDRDLAVVLEPDLEAGPRRRWGIIPTMHLPKTKGGWKKYVVVAARDLDYGQTWFVGWEMSDGSRYLSRIPCLGAVRTLRGDSECRAFAVSPLGVQIALVQLARDTIGRGGPFCHLPLL